MTPSDFNEHLLEAKDTALDTLEDLCAPAFPRRSRIPTTRDDGTLIPYEEQLAMSRLQPPRLNPDEQHVIVMERTMRVRAATTILKTRPIGEDGNPLPISPRHPEHHTRTTPRPANSERAPAGAADRPEDARSQPADSSAATGRQSDPRSGGPTNPPDNANDDTNTSPPLRAEATQTKQPTGSLAAHRSPVANDAGPTREDATVEAASSSTPSPRSTHSLPSSPICANLRSSAALPNPQSEFRNPQSPHAPP